MVALGCAVIVTFVDGAIYAVQPFDAAMVYVTLYVPAVDADGVIAPVELLIDNPAGFDVYTPPLVPVLVTGCAIVNDLQYGPEYEIVALGCAVIVTLVDGVTALHPFDAAMVYVTV